MNARQSWATDRDPVSKTKQTPPPEPLKGKNKENLGVRTREVTHLGLISERQGRFGCCLNLPHEGGQKKTGQVFFLVDLSLENMWFL